MKKRPYLLLALLVCSSTSAMAKLCNQAGYAQEHGVSIWSTTRGIHPFDGLLASSHLYPFDAERCRYDVILLRDGKKINLFSFDFAFCAKTRNTWTRRAQKAKSSEKENKFISVNFEELATISEAKLLDETAAYEASTSNKHISPLPPPHNSRTIPAVHRTQVSCTSLARPGSCTATSSVTDKRHAHPFASPQRAACWGRPASHSLITTNIISSTAPRRFTRPFLRCPDNRLLSSAVSKKLDQHPTDMSDSYCRKGIVSKLNSEQQILM